MRPSLPMLFLPILSQRMFFDLTEEQQRHCITFYQAAITAFSVQALNGSMMMKEKYVMIKDVLLRVQNGVTLGSLRRAGYTQVNAWAKKFAVVVSGDSSVLVERMDIPKRKSNLKRRSANRRSKRHRSTSGRRPRRRIRRKSIRRRSQSESDGDDNNKTTPTATIVIIQSTTRIQKTVTPKKGGKTMMKMNQMAWRTVKMMV